MLEHFRLERLLQYCPKLPLVDQIDSELIKRIKGIVFYIFSKLYSFFNSFNQQPREVNLKPIAMIGCLSIFTIFVISIFRPQGSGIIDPPTPQKVG